MIANIYSAIVGSIRIKSGSSELGSSGKVSIELSASGSNGVSGEVTVSSGLSEAGRSGSLSLQTGSSVGGAGESLLLQVGDGGGLSNGGSLYLAAGQTSSQGRKGGTVTIGTLFIHQKYSTLALMLTPY